MRRGAPVFVAAAAAAAAIGCGETGDPEDKARSTVATFVTSCAQGDAVAASETVNEPAKRTMLEARSPREACALLLGLPLPEAESPEEPLPPAEEPRAEEERLKALLEGVRVEEVVEDGGFAEVRVVTPLDEATVEVERVRGTWLLSATAAPSVEE